MPAPHCAITGLFNCRDRKFGVCRLQFLKTDYVRPFLSQPIHEVGEPLFYVVDIESGDFNFPRVDSLPGFTEQARNPDEVNTALKDTLLLRCSFLRVNPATPRQLIGAKAR
jgi:hypothetical protein